MDICFFENVEFLYKVVYLLFHFENYENTINVTEVWNYMLLYDVDQKKKFDMLIV